MSVRPAAVEASRFSLRSLLPTSSAQTSHPAQQQRAQPITLPTQTSRPNAPSRSQHPNPLSFQLPMSNHAPNMPSSSSQLQTLSGLKFTLPAMRNATHNPTSTHSTAPISDSGASNRSLSAGYLSGGGVTSSSSPEIFRLTALVDDLNAKLNNAALKVASTEQSVARGNAALVSERANSQARIAALSAELQLLNERERVMRVEMASIPRLTDLDAERFKLQAEGAVTLQANYEAEVQKCADLDAQASQLRLQVDTQAAQYSELERLHQTAASELADAEVKILAHENKILFLNSKIESASREQGQDDRVAKLETALVQIRNDSEIEAKRAAASISEHVAELAKLSLKLEKSEERAAQLETKLHFDSFEATSIMEKTDAKIETLRSENDVAVDEIMKLSSALDAAKKKNLGSLTPEQQCVIEKQTDLCLELENAEVDARMHPGCVAMRTKAAHLRRDFQRVVEDNIGVSSTPKALSVSIGSLVKKKEPLSLISGAAFAHRVLSLDCKEDCNVDFLNTNLEIAASEDTEDSVEEEIRMKALIAAVSEDLKVAIMDAAARWERVRLGAAQNSV